MKNIIVLFFAFFAVTAAANAQSKYKTDVSIREQIVNNRVQGAQYRDASVKGKKSGTVQQTSVGAQIKGNAVPGVRYKTTNSGGNEATQPEAAAKVASDKKAEKLPEPKPQKAQEVPQQLTQ
jgi:hypothetical protein